jgi:hypothetical protein
VCEKPSFTRPVSINLQKKEEEEEERERERERHTTISAMTFGWRRGLKRKARKRLTRRIKVV